MDTPPPPPPPPPPAPPPPPSAPLPPPAPAPVPAKSGSGTKILVIILCVLFGLFVLIGGCAVACSYFVAKKAKEYKTSMDKNPQMTTLATVVAMTPDMKVVSKDEDTGHMKVQNTKTGEITDVDTNQYSADSIASSLQKVASGLATVAASVPTPRPVNNDENVSTPTTSEPESAPEQSSAPVEHISSAKLAAFNASMRKFPSYVKTYPSGKTTGATYNTFGGVTLGNYEFTTGDKPDTVLDFYEKKLTGESFTVLARNSDANDFGPTGSLVTNRADPAGTCSIMVESQKNGTKVSVTFSNH